MHTRDHLANRGVVAQREAMGKGSLEALGKGAPGEGTRHDGLEGVAKAYCWRR